MTSNIGATARNIMGFNKDPSLSQNEELKSFFTPEFRNRLDAVVNFKQLNHQVVEDIAVKFIGELNQELEKKDIKINISQKAIEYLVKSGYSLEMGARPLKRYIQDNITNKLSDEILFGRLKNGGIVEVDFNKELILTFKNIDEYPTAK